MAKIVLLEKVEMTEGQRKRLQSLGTVEFYDSSSEQEAAQRVAGADAVVVDWVEPNTFLDAMKSPSLLALMSTGYSWVDTTKAKQRRISVSNIPGYAAEAVAELNIALMLAVARKISGSDARIKDGDKRTAHVRGFELRGRTLGIIGLGSIGRRVAELANGFGMRVLTYNRNQKNVAGISDVPLERLLRESDVVCVTCSLNDASKNMLDAERLGLMKRDAILVGTTWGVVDIAALTKALEQKLIYGAGLDVEVGGELKLPDEFVKLDNLVLTPHVGFNTEESKVRQVDVCIANIDAYLCGRPQNVVNP